MENNCDTAGESRQNDGPNGTRQRVSASTTELIRERDGNLPVWVRAPKRGPEFYSGFTRPKLYDLVSKGCIRSVSIREPGQIKGVRLFELQSILRFIERQCSEALRRKEAVNKREGRALPHSSTEDAE